MNSLQLLLVVGVICAAKGDEKIVGGDDAATDKYPFQVLMFHEDWNPSGNGYVCGGTILDENHFISAGHCFYGYNNVSKYTVAVRKNNLTDDAGQYRGISEFVFHPDFNNDTNEYDLAIAKVDKPFKWGNRVQPAMLSLDDRSVKKNNCWVAGFGWIDEETRENPEVNQEYKAKVVSKKKCIKAAVKANDTSVVFGTGDSIKGYMMCTKNKNQGACEQDSGNALGCFDKRSGNYTMIGVRSWTLASYPCDKGWNVYMRVSKFVDFITELVPGAQFV